jgi:hypothetical protein
LIGRTFLWLSTMIDDTDEDKMKEVEEILSLGSKDEEMV